MAKLRHLEIMIDATASGFVDSTLKIFQCPCLTSMSSVVTYAHLSPCFMSLYYCALEQLSVHYLILNLNSVVLQQPAQSPFYGGVADPFQIGHI